MTTLSEYFRAERSDDKEPVDFYVPGARDWDEMKKADGKSRWHRRTDAPIEQVLLPGYCDLEDPTEQ